MNFTDRNWNSKTVYYISMELWNYNWLRKHIKQIKSIQDFILANSFTELSFFLWISYRIVSYRIVSSVKVNKAICLIPKVQNVLSRSSIAIICKTFQQPHLTLITLDFLTVVFSAGVGVNLNPVSYFKKNLSNINMTLNNC